MGDIELKLNSVEIHPHSEINGSITVNYSGPYDGIVINTQILDSNELIIYKSYNGKKISQNVSRLFIDKETMPENKAVFTAVIEFVFTHEQEIAYHCEPHPWMKGTLIITKQRF